MARLDEEFETRWHQEAEAVMSGMKEWRLQHPKATFREIEAAVDEQLSGMHARRWKIWRWRHARPISRTSKRASGHAVPVVGTGWRVRVSRSAPS